MDSVAGQAIAGTITAMLVALFSLLVRAMLKVGDRDVGRYEKEITRLQAEIDKRQSDANMWRDLYLGVTKITGIEPIIPDAAFEPPTPQPENPGTTTPQAGTTDGTPKD